MSIATEAGFVVGTIGYIAQPALMLEWWGTPFIVNDEVELIRDDESRAPLFKVLTGVNAGQSLYLPVEGMSLTPVNVTPVYLTPAQEMGLEVGTIAYVVNPRDVGLGNMKAGDIVELGYDDNSNCPSFRITSGYHEGEEAYLNLMALSLTLPSHITPELRRGDLVAGKRYLVTNALPSNREYFQNGDEIEFTGNVSNSSSGMAYFVGGNGEEYAMYIDEISEMPEQPVLVTEVVETDVAPRLYKVVNGIDSNPRGFRTKDIITPRDESYRDGESGAFINSDGEHLWMYSHEIERMEPVEVKVVAPVAPVEEVVAPVYYVVVDALESNPDGFKNGDIITKKYCEGAATGGTYINSQGMEYWMYSGEIEVYNPYFSEPVNIELVGSGANEVITNDHWDYAVEEVQPELYQIGDFFRIIGSEGAGAAGDIVVMVGDCCINPMINCHNFRMGHSIMKLKVNLEKISYLEALEELNTPVQTLCESMGFNVGDMFVIVSDNDAFEEHEIVTLIEDDGTDEPRFFGSNSTRGDNLSINHVRKLSKEEAQEELVAMYELPFMRNFVKYAA